MKLRGPGGGSGWNWVLTSIGGVSLGLDDLVLDLALVEVDRAFGEGGHKAGHGSGLVEVEGGQRPRRPVTVGRQPPLGTAECAKERRPADGSVIV